jgi:hypothetical protein
MWAPNMQRSASFLIALALVGCGVSPQPEPPSQQPKVDASAFGHPTNVIVEGIAFSARPGAVDPPEGELFAINLDRTDPPVIVAVQPDGGVAAFGVPGAPGDEFRFQVRSAAGRSDPIDLAVDVVAPRLVVHPLADCLIVVPAAELDLGTASERPILVRNDCGTALSFAAPRLRTASAAFSLAEGTAAFALGDGQTTAFNVRFAPQAPGAAEEILFLEVPAAERDRRPISLFARSP